MKTPIPKKYYNFRIYKDTNSAYFVLECFLHNSISQQVINVHSILESRSDFCAKRKNYTLYCMDCLEQIGKNIYLPGADNILESNRLYINESKIPFFTEALKVGSIFIKHTINSVLKDKK